MIGAGGILTVVFKRVPGQKLLELETGDIGRHRSAAAVGNDAVIESFIGNLYAGDRQSCRPC